MSFASRMEQRCDQIIDCNDNSDEKNCDLLVFKQEESYNKKVAPFSLDEDKKIIPVEVEVSTSLMNVLAISERDHTIDLKLGISLKWRDNRVLYNNLKIEEALNILSDREVRQKLRNKAVYNIVVRLTNSGSPTSYSGTRTVTRRSPWMETSGIELSMMNFLEILTIFGNGLGLSP